MNRGSEDLDPLTGLLSRKAFEERFRAEASGTAAEEGMFSLGFLDIDFFKNVNETHGHAVGDAVIRTVAEAIKSVVGETGASARYGGEEFAVLLPAMEKEQAFLMVERIRVAMESAAPPAREGLHPGPRVTVSGGVAAFPADGRTQSEIVRKADHALYRAKVTGRNKVCIALEERMATKTTHFTMTQLERLAKLAKEEGVGEAVLLREALDDLLIKYKVSGVES
jgi:diguanylate cyclase (GGDEF)-like protein